jgi:hypothetical protein
VGAIKTVPTLLTATSLILPQLKLTFWKRGFLKMEIRRTYIVPADHILHLKVPDVPKGEEVEVFIHTKNGAPNKSAKFALLAKAANDPLYLQDIHEIEDDFSDSDSEHA